ERNIKTLIGKDSFDPNPTSRKETKQRLAPIESFALEAGTEGLLKLTILPHYAIGTVRQRLVAGSDWTELFRSPVHGEGKGNPLGALMKMGKYLYDIFSNKPKVHPKLRFYIDDEIRDEKRRQNLNQGLLALLKAKQAKCYIFPANEIWKLYGT